MEGVRALGGLVDLHRDHSPSVMFSFPVLVRTGVTLAHSLLLHFVRVIEVRKEMP
jgi:hypothetical protein